MKYTEQDFRNIGDRIREARNSKDWSQDDFIEKLAEHGCTIARNRLSGIENGHPINIKDKETGEIVGKKQYQLSFDFLLAVCEIFGWDMGHLFGEYEEKTQLNHLICKETGLTEKALEKVKDMYSKNAETAFSDIISLMIEDMDAEYLLALIGQKISIAKERAKCVTDDQKVKNAVDRTMHLDFDNVRVHVYKDGLIDSLLQTEFIKSLAVITEVYNQRYEKTPIQRFQEEGSGK